MQKNKSNRLPREDGKIIIFTAMGAAFGAVVGTIAGGDVGLCIGMGCALGCALGFIVASKSERATEN